jgi:hypothetical protein
MVPLPWAQVQGACKLDTAASTAHAGGSLAFGKRNGLSTCSIRQCSPLLPTPGSDLSQLFTAVGTLLAAIAHCAYWHAKGLYLLCLNNALGAGRKGMVWSKLVVVEAYITTNRFIICCNDFLQSLHPIKIASSTASCSLTSDPLTLWVTCRNPH